MEWDGGKKSSCEATVGERLFGVSLSVSMFGPAALCFVFLTECYADLYCFKYDNVVAENTRLNECCFGE